MVRRTRYVINDPKPYPDFGTPYRAIGIGVLLWIITVVPVVLAQETPNASAVQVVNNATSQDVEFRVQEGSVPPPPPGDDRGFRRGERRRRPPTPEDEERWKLFRRWHEAYERDPERVKGMMERFFGEDRMKWLKEHAPDLYQATINEQEQEKKWYALVQEYHQAADRAKREELVPQIKKECETLYDLRMNRQTLDLELMRKRFDWMEQALNERKAKRDEQIEEMVSKSLERLPPPPGEGGFPPRFGRPPRDKNGNPLPPPPGGERPPEGAPQP